MWGLDELKTHKEILDEIDLDMTPEKAVETYLEWGTGWSRKEDCKRWPGQESLYFVVYAWEDPPCVTLIRQGSQGSMEVAKIHAPPKMVQDCIDAGGKKPGVGVYAINEPLKMWLRRLLGI
ncbi:MAG: hypothetical protein GX443_14405 [Deltaproteobacteria bacterium]|nr:hypothetical protein [Deltaproteobacteria bacterium]